MMFYALVPISSGTFIQRFLMANDSRQLNKVLINTALISLPLTLVICLIGFIIKVKAPEINSNTAFYYLIGNYLPIGITGLLITGILAAIMSTADSWLNTTSVLCAHDIIKGLFPKLTEAQELFIARVSVLMISMLSMLLAFSWQSLMSLIWLAGNFWEPLILIPLIAGFLKFQTNQRSFICGSVFGILGTFFGRYIAGEFATTSLLFGTIGSAIGLFGMHYLQKLLYKQIPQYIGPNLEVTR
jgi:Na+/proline symporter